jgi:two-component system, chemotaxis family, sensor kinase Cph1
MVQPKINQIPGPIKNYDSAFCGSLPLHFVNMIQPHGLLVVVDQEENKVRQVSENIGDFFGLPVADFLNQPVTDFLEPGIWEGILGKSQKWQIKDRIPEDLLFTANGRQVDFNTIFHFREQFLLLELEPKREEVGKPDFIRVYQEIKYIMAALKEARDTSELVQIAALEIKRLSGFDRVMLYKFDQDWNGLVVAEAREENLDPYLGLWFPASDVPRNARELYLRNPYRLIPDREFTPARLVPVINPVTSHFTDLSDCNLRSVPAVHLEYLKNMGVKASMSTPIIKDDGLWGLISCHHNTPRHLNFELLSAFELVSPIISAQLSAREREQNLVRINELGLLYNRLLSQMYHELDFRVGLLRKETSLLDIFSCTGGAIAYDGEIHRQGDTPGPEQIKELVRWLQRLGVDRVFETSSLPKMFEKSASLKHLASGLIALAISRERGEYILGFRQEMVQTVEWGGNPNEAIQFEADGKTYHPRHSFSVWKETVKNTSLPWSAPELAIAETLRTSVLERVLKETY